MSSPVDVGQLLPDAWRITTRTSRDRPRAVLGLAGPPGTGKSTLARALVAGLRREHGRLAAAYVPLDGFHLAGAQLARLGLTDRKGSPPTFDTAGYAALLDRLVDPAVAAQQDVYCPDFDRTLDEPIAARLVVPAGVRLIVTEGNYLATRLPGWAAARARIDALWYLDTPDEVREERLISRQLAGGRTGGAARSWVTGNDAPNGELVKADRDAPWVNRVVHWSGL